MQFVYPAFLWALAALAIPIIIHLFYFRRFRKVLFTNVRFLREVKEERSSRQRLRNLLVLAMRLLAVAFMVFAFAQPFIPVSESVKAGRNAVSVFVDNSFSMGALSQDVPLLEKAKERAREIVKAYSVEDRFQVLTNDFEGRHQRLLGQEEALALIDEIKPSPATRLLSTVVARQRQALSSGGDEVQKAYLISDFQQNIADLGVWQDSALDLSLVPLQAVQERNVAIDTAWFEAPVPLLNQNNTLLVRIRNYTSEDLDNVRLALRYEGQTKPEGVLTIPAGGEVIDTVNINVQRPGLQTAELTITDYPVQFDDSYFFSFRVNEKIPVLAISDGEPNRYLSAALRGLRVFESTFSGSQAIDYARLNSYQLIVLDGLADVSSGLAAELKNYVEQGGNVLVFPGQNANISGYRSFLSGMGANELEAFEKQERTVGHLNGEEFVFRDVFFNRNDNLRLPTTQGNFRMSRFGGRGEEQLLRYRDGSTYLGKYRRGEGHLYLCAAPLDESLNNLTQNAEVFVPMLYRMSISAGRSRPIAYTIGRDEVIASEQTVKNAEQVFKLKGQGGEFIPEQRSVGAQLLLSVGAQIPQAGFYDLFLTPEEALDNFAFNYDRRESELTYLRPSELSERVGELAHLINTENDAAITTEIEEQSQGIVLWRWCIMLVLLFLAVETLLLRFWKE